jgi:hypothetical protein
VAGVGGHHGKMSRSLWSPCPDEACLLGTRGTPQRQPTAWRGGRQVHTAEREWLGLLQKLCVTKACVGGNDQHGKRLGAAPAGGISVASSGDGARVGSGEVGRWLGCLHRWAG